MMNEGLLFLFFIILVFFFSRPNLNSEEAKDKRTDSCVVDEPVKMSKENIQTIVTLSEILIKDSYQMKEIDKLYQRLREVKGSYMKFCKKRGIELQPLFDEFKPNFIIDPDISLENVIGEERFKNLGAKEFISILNEETKKHHEFDKKIVSNYISQRSKYSEYGMSGQTKNSYKTGMYAYSLTEDNVVIRSTDNEIPRSFREKYNPTRNPTDTYYINKYGLMTKKREYDDSD